MNTLQASKCLDPLDNKAESRHSSTEKAVQNNLDFINDIKVWYVSALLDDDGYKYSLTSLI
jgi:hypothetical protein